jgi:nucleoside-triphosphatase
MARQGKNVLLTGRPACGKTTLVRRVIEQLSDLRAAGFYTQEIRRQGKRLGFQAVGLSGGRAVLAHVVFRSPLRVGRYGVQLEEFEALVEAELGKAATEVDLFVIDEIGKMECYSERFVAAVREVLDGPVPVLGTVGYKGRGFIEEVKRRGDVRVIEVTPANRDELVGGLVGRVKKSEARNTKYETNSKSE